MPAGGEALVGHCAFHRQEIASEAGVRPVRLKVHFGFAGHWREVQGTGALQSEVELEVVACRDRHLRVQARPQHRRPAACLETQWLPVHDQRHIVADAPNIANP